MDQSRVFLYGDINLDVSMLVPEFPSPGRDAYAEQLAFNLGGSSTNTAVILHQLGYVTDLFGSIGMDINGDYLLNELKMFGLDTHHVRRKEESASGQIFLPILPDGERAMYSFRGANVFTRPHDIPPGWEQQSQLLHLSGYVFLKSPQMDTAMELIKTAKGGLVPVSLDTGLDPVLVAGERMRSILDDVKLWICGLREGTILTGYEQASDIIKAFFDHGAACVALKLGKRGCLVGMRDQILEFPAIRVKTMDTTGCGDAFTAGILSAWLACFDLPDMGTLANGLGAYTAARLGSIQQGLSWSSLFEFLNEKSATQGKAVQVNIAKLLKTIKRFI